jgi:hypothetical protein
MKNLPLVDKEKSGVALGTRESLVKKGNKMLKLQSFWRSE